MAVLHLAASNVSNDSNAVNSHVPVSKPLDLSKVEAALKLVESHTSPTEAAKQLGIGRSTVYREVRRIGVGRPA